MQSYKKKLNKLNKIKQVISHKRALRMMKLLFCKFKAKTLYKSNYKSNEFN